MKPNFEELPIGIREVIVRSTVVALPPSVCGRYPHLSVDVKNIIDEEYDCYNTEEVAQLVIDEINRLSNELTKLYKTLGRLGYEVK